MQSSMVFGLFCVLLASAITIVTSLSCMPCYHPETQEPFEVCRPLPDDCQPGFLPCGCCPVCSLKKGGRCSGMSPKCEEGLFCTARGRRLKFVPWWSRFVGVCLPSEKGPTKPLGPSDPDA